MVRATEIDLAAVRGEDQATGVSHDRALLAYTDAVMADDAAAISSCRDAVEEVLGGAGVVDTAAVIAMFNVVDRVAGATGIPIDDNMAREMRYGVGEELGMLDLSPEQRAAR
jgi:alkylhydroperoxidase family enzyme